MTKKITVYGDLANIKADIYGYCQAEIEEEKWENMNTSEKRNFLIENATIEFEEVNITQLGGITNIERE
ncbi:hypothetical protein [Peptostreptococcus faecalis]|uniref:hypothetical protein n=1 Tax=Peptostreptococcus faecalis TaxID=2045015 RepID=UPI0011AECB63|nr:hypothetical protein [Peptostreptococcus faecalis]